MKTHWLSLPFAQTMCRWRASSKAAIAWASVCRASLAASDEVELLAQHRADRQQLARSSSAAARGGGPGRRRRAARTARRPAPAARRASPPRPAPARRTRPARAAPPSHERAAPASRSTTPTASSGSGPAIDSTSLRTSAAWKAGSVRWAAGCRARSRWPRGTSSERKAATSRTRTLGVAGSALPGGQHLERQLVGPLAVVQQHQHGPAGRPQRVQEGGQRLHAAGLGERLGAELVAGVASRADSASSGRAEHAASSVAQAGPDRLRQARLQAGRRDQPARPRRSAAGRGAGRPGRGPGRAASTPPVARRAGRTRPAGGSCRRPIRPPAAPARLVPPASRSS